MSQSELQKGCEHACQKYLPRGRLATCEVSEDYFLWNPLNTIRMQLTSSSKLNTSQKDIRIRCRS